MKKISILGLLLFLCACSAQQNQSISSDASSSYEQTSSAFSETVVSGFTANDPVTFSTGNTSTIITKHTQPFDEMMLHGRTKQTNFCHMLTQDRVDALHQAFDGQTVTEYTVSDPRFGADQSLYEIDVLPNAARYKTLSAFKQDFDMCAVGGVYPIHLNAKWLISGGNFCGGVSAAKSDECDAVSKKIEATLRIQ